MSFVGFNRGPETEGDHRVQATRRGWAPGRSSPRRHGPLFHTAHGSRVSVGQAGTGPGIQGRARAVRRNADGTFSSDGGTLAYLSTAMSVRTPRRRSVVVDRDGGGHTASARRARSGLCTHLVARRDEDRLRRGQRDRRRRGGDRTVNESRREAAPPNGSTTTRSSSPHIVSRLRRHMTLETDRRREG